MKKIFLGGSLAAICLLHCLQIKAQRPELMIPATHAASSVQYSPDGKWLVSEGVDGIKIWDVQTKTLLKNLQPGSRKNDRFGDGRLPIAFNSNNKNFVFQVEDTLYIFDMDKFAITNKYEVNGKRTALLLDENNLFAAGRYKDETADIVLEKTIIGSGKPALLKRLTYTRDYFNEASAMCLSPDKNTLLLYDAFLSTWLLDVGTGDIKKQFKYTGNLLPFAWEKNGNLLAYTGAPEKALYIQELSGNAYTPLRRSKLIFKNEIETPDAFYDVKTFYSANQKYLLIYEGISRFFDASNFSISPKKELPYISAASAYTSKDAIALEPNSENYIRAANMSSCNASTHDVLFTYGKFPLDSYVQFVYKNKDAVVLKDRILNFDNGKFNMRLVDPNFGSDYTGFIYRLTADGKRGFLYSQETGLYTFDPADYPVKYMTVPKISNLGKKFVGMQVFDDLNLLALTGNEGIYVLDLSTLKVLYIIDIPQGFSYYGYERLNKYCDFSPDKTKMILYAKAKEDSTNIIYCMNLEDNNERWFSESVNIENLRFTNDGKKIMFTSNDKLIYLDADNGKQTGASLQLPKSDFATIISPSSKYAATPLPIDGNPSLGFNVGLVDALNNKLTGTLPGTGDYVNGFVFLKNERYLLTEEYGGICLWDIIKKRKIGKLYMFEKSPDWIFLTDDGRFDATPDALKFMYYTKGKEIIPLESLFEKFFVPGLLKQVWDNTLPNDVPDINTLKKAPLVKINVDDKDRNLEVADDTKQVKTAKEKVIIKIDASSADDVVDEIRLYQNGKLTGTTRNLVVADDDEKNTKEKTRSFNVTLQPGVNNFKAVAINSERTESLPALLDVSYTPAITPPNPASDIQLYLFVVGVNTYKNPKYSLNYASADANAVITALQDGAKNLFSKVNTTYLKDDGATREGMAAAFEKIKSEARPQDMFVFYYAGHGVINDKKEFFLVPYDVTQLYGNDGALAQKGFSAAALQQMSKDIKAQKQLFILDACQSAGALQTIAGTRGQAEEQAIAQLARSTGTQWLTASGSEQFASEFEQLGHGSFTYCLLQAFAGDAGNKDNRLTVKQLDAYLQNKVPEITKKYKGTEQYPSSYSYGNDFPIIIIKSKN
ncbi:MAG: caspase family protein [Ferruginibacter sp.]